MSLDTQAKNGKRVCVLQFSFINRRCAAMFADFFLGAPAARAFYSLFTPFHIPSALFSHKGRIKTPPTFVHFALNRGGF